MLNLTFPIKLSPSLYRAIAELTVGNHVCLIYDSKEEQLAIAITFIKIGLEKGEKCIYIADDNTITTIDEVMRLQGINVDHYIAQGALIITDQKESWLNKEKFEPDDLISFLKKSTQEAIDQGFTALRATGEMTWALGNIPGIERLVEYESKLNSELFPYYPIVSICQYNAKRFPAKTLKGIIQTHPFIINCGCLTKNFHYIPPEEFLHEADAQKEVARLLANIQERGTLEQKLTDLIGTQQTELTNLENNLPGFCYQYLHPANAFEGNFLNITAGVAQYCNLDPESIKTNSNLFWELIHPEDFEMVKNSLLEAAVNGKQWKQEWRMLLSDGQQLWLKSVTQSPLKIQQNLLWHGLMLDITHQKELEAKLNHHQQIVSGLINSNPESVLLIDTKGTVLVANSTVANRFRIKLTNIIGHNLKDFMEAEIFNSRWQKITEVVQTGKPLHFEDFRLGRYVDNYIQPITDGRGKVVQLALLGIDITDYKAMEEKLEQNKVQLQAILDYSSALISIQDLDGNLILASRNFSNLDVPKLTELLDKNVFEIFSEYVANQVWTNSLIALKTGTSVEFEEVFKHKDGTNHVYLTSRFPVFKESNQPFGICAIATEITERKQTEQTLILNQKRQEALLGLYEKTYSSEIDVIKFALQEAVKLTESKLGYLYFLSSHYNNQLLFSYSNADPQCQISSYPNLEQLTIWQNCLEQKQAIMQNDANCLIVQESDQHSLIMRHLSLPLVENNQVVAVICVANKINNYEDNDLRQLGLFLRGMWSILQLKRAETSLQQLNIQLEQKVNERTNELVVSNKLLERRHQDLILLSELNDTIQLCQGLEEAYEAIAICGNKLFPELSGTIAMFNPLDKRMSVVAAWGEQLSSSAFKSDDCWALRRGQYHWYDRTHINLQCHHFDTKQPTAYICLPMIAQSELFGLMTLCSTEYNATFSKTTVQMAVTVIDSIKLGIANLKLRETLSEQAIRDPLTQLYNRRYMEETLTRELYQAERSHSTIGIIMIDIDYFKQFNDNFGHDAGDFLLKRLSNLLQRHIRQGDIACRYGGEEFMLILPNSSLEITQQRAETLRQQAENLSLQFQDQILAPISLSLGVSLFPKHGNTRDLVIHAADVALYRAKHEGRNRVCLA